jgi:hypothetical protein
MPPSSSSFTKLVTQPLSQFGGPLEDSIPTSQKFLLELSGGPTSSQQTSLRSIGIGCHSKHDPLISFASHTIQSLFGDIVQAVADCLQCRGALTLPEIVSFLLPKTSQASVLPSSRTIVNKTAFYPTSYSQRNKGGVSSLPQALTVSHIKAALIVLIQHSIVVTTTKCPPIPPNKTSSSISKKNKQRLPTPITVYRYQPLRAIYMNQRYAKFIEYVRKAMVTVHSSTNNASAIIDQSPSIVMEELLLFGRLSTIDLVLYAIQRLKDTSTVTTTTNDDSNRKHNIVAALLKLVTSCFITAVCPNNDKTDDEEHEWSDKTSFDTRPQKRMKESAFQIDETASLFWGEAQSIANILTADKTYRNLLPINTVWTVNIQICHDHLRAYHFGKYISERYGQNSLRGGTSNGTNPQSPFSCIGSLVTAALKHRAYRVHTVTDVHANSRCVSYFNVADLMKYLPKSVLNTLEKKIGDSASSRFDLEHRIERILCDICALEYHPHFIRRVNDSYQDSMNKEQKQPLTFEIVLSTISNEYIDRIIYQIVHDRHGAIAARVVSILSAKGYLESDKIAEIAMVPAKDTREVLHHLYRSRYVELLQLSNSSRQQYNPNNTIYLWGIERKKLIQRMTDDVAKALCNIRIRRKHEIETAGTKWVERMTTTQQQPEPCSLIHMNTATSDKNTDMNMPSAIDRENYAKFCSGLERLDVASIQLDETLMFLFDFPKIIL